LIKYRTDGKDDEHHPLKAILFHFSKFLMQQNKFNKKLDFVILLS
jgi:hypothetical protein